jgi:hypothetical protein
MPTPTPDFAEFEFLAWRPVVYTILSLAFVTGLYIIYKYFNRSHFSLWHFMSKLAGWQDAEEEERERKMHVSSSYLPLPLFVIACMHA